MAEAVAPEYDPGEKGAPADEPTDCPVCVEAFANVTLETYKCPEVSPPPVAEPWSWVSVGVVGGAAIGGALGYAAGRRNNGDGASLPPGGGAVTEAISRGSATKVDGV